MVLIDFGPYHICGYRLVPPPASLSVERGKYPSIYSIRGKVIQFRLACHCFAINYP